MIEVRDSWLHYLSDNLSGLTIHPLRYDVNTPDAATLAMNALNVQFLNVDLGVDLSTQHVVLDVVMDDENTAVAAMELVWSLLNAKFFCSLLDYTVPSTPVALNTNIIWDRYGVKFRRVHSDFYCHYTCSLRLRFHPS